MSSAPEGDQVVSRYCLFLPHDITNGPDYVFGSVLDMNLFREPKRTSKLHRLACRWPGGCLLVWVSRILNERASSHESVASGSSGHSM